MQQEEFKKCLARMQALCSRSEKCRADIRLKLEQAGVPPAETAEILNELEKDRFLDQERYATAYARDKSNLQGWGPRKIYNGLRMKEISQDIIERLYRNRKLLSKDWRSPKSTGVRDKIP